MKYIVVILLFAISFQSCTSDSIKTRFEEKSDQRVLPPSSAKHLYWYDSLIINYLSTTNNELIRASLQDSLREDWLFDRIEDEGKSKYLVFQIGHDMSDSGGANMRFVTDSWVYIDSISRKLYEYDIINDTLIK